MVRDSRSRVNLNVDAQAVIDELSMQVAQLVRDNAVLRVQVSNLGDQLQEFSNDKKSEA